MKFYKAVVFCSNPVKGMLRVENIFQIYPLSVDDAPNDDRVPAYPFVIEYCVTDSEEIELEDELKKISPIVSDLTHSTNLQNKILNLLTTFSNYHFYFPKLNIQWFASIDKELSEKEINEQTSKVGITAYTYPSLTKDALITSFSKVSFPEISPQKHPGCFMKLDLLGNEEVTFSQHILGAFHNYFLLTKEEQESVDAAALLITQGIQLRESMKSLSFVAFVSSIETMVDLENKNTKVVKCETCKQDLYKVMAKFRNYLFKYSIADETAKKRINAIYQIRSKIAHAGMLLLGDGKIDWSSNPGANEQWKTHIDTMQISRLSLMNWILMRSEEQGENKSETITEN